MTESVSIYDDRQCYLGEGTFWHPLRKQLFWFDIVNCRLLSRTKNEQLCWEFDQNVSAAGWIDREHLLIASETGLFRFNLETNQQAPLCSIEADDETTRSNDGRADPWGGFWIGTMSKSGEAGKGALYRWLPNNQENKLRVIETEMSTPNSICFDRDRNYAYFSDTKTRIIWRHSVDPVTGWPVDEKQIFLDLKGAKNSQERKPDGAIIDSEGCLWSAQWGSARVARYSPDGQFLMAIEFPTGHTSCPAFGGPKLDTLFVSTAQQNLLDTAKDWLPNAGKLHSANTSFTGIAEPQVKVSID
ncbi:SMP-30/gluconolactonase/LRE family protein [Shimia sp. R9_1]|uniref:SMP-30/gluconolactonase/LRE family protein n=1 Tax=unclassified Shimia TaxID=2630038 RepID=UPI001ADC0BF4|nr:MULTISPECIES: SMP-30/gluconolactonase/LRE family protein [unclassified Shimia]MBO9395296.1 SMP-30/gluconolactonase/LRE family protein [Shimia sp. R9_2]MBO9407301.1 SMP-30/gluconolactonase/LRE family protein [Shimia sp. R9_1]